MEKDFLTRKQTFFDTWAPHYDCLLTTIFYQAVHQRLLTYVTLPPQPTVLDLGCGTGKLLSRLAKQFPSLKGTGLDLSQEMLRQARAGNVHHPRLIYLQGNAEKLPFAEKQFDAVFNTISFLHYRYPQQVLSEIKRILASDGNFYLVDYTVGKLATVPISPGGLRFYSAKEREDLGKSVGLKCLGHYYLVGRVLLSIFVTS